MKSSSNHFQKEQQPRISHAPPMLVPDYRGHDLIFIISQPRAGSTLLQRLISGHAEIHATAEPWLMLHPLYALKNSGIQTEYRASLARHALQDFLAQFPDGESVYIQSLRQQAAFLYQSALKLAGKRYFLDKTPRYYHVLPDLYRVFPDAKFILLFRNPLAVFSSTLKTWLNNDLSLIDAATRQDLYEAPQKLIDGARGLKENAIIVNYEQLVMQPLAELKRIFVRLELVFQDDLLEYDSRTPPAGRFGDSENVQRHARPVSTYVNKWMANLNKPDLVEAADSLLTHIGEDTIVQMGYSFTKLKKTIETLKKGLVPDRPISQNTSEFLQKGAQLMAANKIEAAAITYMKLIEENPMNPEALLGMAHVSLASGRPKDALDFCVQVKKIAPQILELEPMLAKIDQIASRSSVKSEKNLRAQIRDNDGQERLAESDNRIPVLIYQMGKVGSTTIRDSLDAHQIYNQHVHRLSWEGIRQAEERYQRIRSGQIPAHIVRYRALREFIDRTPTDTRWQIITLVRDPIARLISSVFQNLDVIFPEAERFDDSHLPHIEQHILEQLHRIKKDEAGDDSVWFDDELKHVFEFDIFKETFDSHEGYCIYHHKKVDVLAIRMEQLTACGSQAISAFLALKHFKLINANESHKKPYHAIYRKLLASINIPEAVLDRVYTSRLAEHFYSTSEVDSFKKRWRLNRIPKIHGWTGRSPRVSAIVSTYNSQRFIEGRLQNLIDQSLFRQGQLEIIVVDSNSSENESAIVDSFRKTHPQIKYIRTPVRETIYAAWNRGLNASRGTYFVNANADDRFAEDALETMADELDRQPEYDAVYGNWLVTQTPNDTFESETPKRLFIYPDFHPGLFFYLQITSHANFIRRKIFEKIGPFNDIYTVFGDREFMLRFAANGSRALKLEKIVGLYLENPQSLERSNKKMGMNECVPLYRQYLEPAYFARLMGIDSDTSNKVLSDAYTEVGCFGRGLFLIDDNYGHALGSPTRLFAKAIEFNPANVAALNNMGVIAHHRHAKDEAIRFFENASPLASNEQREILNHNLKQIHKNVAGRNEPLNFIYPAGYQSFYVIDVACDTNQSSSSEGTRRTQTRTRSYNRKKKRRSTRRRQRPSLARKQRQASRHGQLLQQAQRFYLREDFQSAFKVLSNIITANSEQWDAYHLFLDLVPLHDDESAFPVVLKALGNRSDMPPDVLASIGMAYDAAGQLKQAALFARRAFGLDDNCARAWNLEGVIAYRRGKYATAAAHFKKAARCDASWGDPWTNLGILHWEQNNKSTALDCFEKGLALSPTSPHIPDAYYSAVVDTQNIARALPILKKICSTYPHFKKIHLLYIDALIKDEADHSVLAEIKNFVNQFGPHRELSQIERSIGKKLSRPIEGTDQDQAENGHLGVEGNTINDAANPQKTVSLILFGDSDNDLPDDHLSTWLKIDSNLVRDIISLAPQIKGHLASDAPESLGSLQRWHIDLDRSLGRQINAIIATLSTDTIAFAQNDLSFFDGWLAYLIQNRNVIDRPGVSGPLGRFAKSPLQRWDESDDSEGIDILREPFCNRVIPASTVEPFCFIVDRNAFLKMGGFQDGYHTLHMGLQDLCYRFKLAGYRNFISGGIVLTLKGEREPAPIWSNPECLVADQKHFAQTFEATGTAATAHAQTLSAIWLDQSCNQYLQGRWQEARESLQKALEAQPDNWTAYHHMTDMLMSVEASAPIPDEVPSIITHNQIPAATLATLGNLFAYTGDLEKASELAEASYSKEPDNPFALNLRGCLAFEHRDFETAAGLFDQAARKRPHWGDPWTNMGMIHWALGQFDQALDCFEKGFVLSPTAPHVAANYHAALCKTAAFSRGLFFFEDVLRRYPGFSIGSHLIIDLLIKMGRIQSAMDLTETLLIRNPIDPGLLDAALAVREKLGPIEIKADQTPTLSLCMIVKNEEELLAQCLASLKPVVDEIIVVDTGSDDQTRSIAVAFGARVYRFEWIDDFAAARNFSLTRAKGDWILVMDADETISAQDHGRLRELLNTSPSSKVAYSMVTRNYMNRYNTDGWVANDGFYGKEEKSSGWVPSQKVRLFRNDSQIRFEYPVHEVVDHSLKKAGNCIRPASIPIHHYGKMSRKNAQSKGETYYRIGLNKLAESENHPKALRELAIQAAELDHFEEAITLWRRLLEQEPSNSKAWTNLSALYIQTGQYEKSNQAAREAVASEPDRKEGHLNLGVSEIYLGNARIAIEILKNLIKRHPDYPPAIFFCGAAQVCASQLSAGRKTFTRLKNAPTWKYIVHAFGDLAQRLYKAGQLEYAQRLITVAEDLKPGDEALPNLKAALSAAPFKSDGGHTTYQEAV